LMEKKSLMQPNRQPGSKHIPTGAFPQFVHSKFHAKANCGINSFSE
jgi:hypothetical protein